MHQAETVLSGGSSVPPDSSLRKCETTSSSPRLARIFPVRNPAETRGAHALFMLRTIGMIPGGLAHYLIGSLYLMAHLATCERRLRELS
jgi:hypothetical protein